MGTWNKSDLARYVSEQTGVSKGKALSALDATFAGIREALHEGQGITITGFGGWKIVDVAACTRRDPRNGEPVECPATRRAAWKASKGLMEGMK